MTAHDFMTPEYTQVLAKSVQEWTNRGYVCVPASVELDDAGEKVTRFAAWKHLTETPKAWEGHTGVAIATGPSGLVVVDIDVSDGKDGEAGLKEAGIVLPYTPLRVHSRAGGMHFYYRARSDIAVGTSQGVLARDVDVRGVGGLIFAPPTIVGNSGGADYQVTRNARDSGVGNVSSLPEFPLDLATKLAMTTRQPRGRQDSLDDTFEPDPRLTDELRKYGRRKLEFKLSDIAAARNGERNEVLGRTVIRIAGIAKTLGEDLNATADKIRAAYEESGGTDTKQVEDWIRNGFAAAEPENPEEWLRSETSSEFWTARPELAHIRQAAHASMAAPFAVLGVLAVRVLADVPPNYLLDTGLSPAGGNLNLFVALAAPSGGGKGVATEVAAHLYKNDVYQTEVASGEALPTLFARTVKGEQEQTRWSAIVDAPEFSSLRASGDRSGSTLVSRLCYAFSGSALTFARADADKNVDVPARSYRLGLITGIQYANADMLLSPEAAGTGLPQRFLWMPATDPSAPDAVPEWPGTLPRQVAWSRNETWIRVCDEARAEMMNQRRDVQHERAVNPLDGHKLYARCKLAYALAVLNGRQEEVNAEDWRLAGLVIKESDASRARAESEIAAKSARKAEAAGRADGVRKVASAEVEAAEIERRVEGYITRYLEKNGHSSRSRLRQAVVGSLREHADDVLAGLVDSGSVVEINDGYFQLVSQ